jgi:hypothetical protein
LYKFPVHRRHRRHVKFLGYVPQFQVGAEGVAPLPDHADIFTRAKRHLNIVSRCQHHAVGHPVGVGAVNGER